jgi:GR25 family glycosyltransferase involved in LPS biosynthesis/glycosyltransferase involved in cell wall biosynthesis
MIVKNEGHIIGETLEKLVKQINFSYWVICDTGSTDKTCEIITEFFKKKGIHGELLHHEWVDFGYNRTLALKGAYKKADYIFIFDADDTIHGNVIIPKLTHDMYKMKFGSGFTYLRPLLVTAHKKSKFVGVLHEYLTLEEGNPSDCIIEGNYYIDSGKSGARSLDKDKYYKDALVLKAAYQKEVETGGQLAGRYAFYCAQSFRDCGKNDESIEWYTLVVEKLNNWVQEKYYSCLMLGKQYQTKGNFQKAVEYFLKAEQNDPERMEGVIFAVEMLKDSHMNSLVILLYEKYKNYNKNPQDKLFLFEDIYRDVFEFNTSISALNCNNKKLAYLCIKKIILNNIANKVLIENSFKNLRLLVSEMNEDPDTLKLFYMMSNYIQTCTNVKEMTVLWKILLKKNRTELTKSSKLKMPEYKNKVFLSITSCKRLDLFIETVNSILNHWNDIGEIDYWFCVDDNSTKEDRKVMQKMYPFMHFYMKKPEEKGHRDSMNIIWNKLAEMKPKYWIHLEDDFLFYIKRSYIKDSIKFLDASMNIKQVLFNRGYAETVDNLDVRGYIPISPGFVVHEYKTGSFSYNNCHYWPHYSFRPSIIDVETILKLGNYNSENTFFERDYADKWTSAGYKSAFFDIVCCMHIGRLTSEIKSKTVKNAYELNNENQFTNESKITNQITNQIQITNQTNNNIKILNLKRRQDRKEAMINLFKSIQIEEYEFVEAIDGKELKVTNDLINLFKGNDFGNRSGFIGCALSHYNLWKELLSNPSAEYYIIFEDDVSLSSNFKIAYQALKTDNILKNFDYLFLGYHMFKENREATKDIYVKESNNFQISEMQNNLNIGAGFAYSINKNGASILIDYIQKNGIKHGIDYVVKICNQLKKTEIRPQIVFSQWYQFPGDKVDSDIQKDHHSLELNKVDSDIQKDHHSLELNKVDSDIQKDHSLELNNINVIDEFTFFQGLDHKNDDLLFFDKLSLKECKKKAIETPGCVGFNTLGFFKSKIDIKTLTPSIYFKEKDGLYVRNVKTKIKLIGNWQSCEQMAQEYGLMRQTDFVLTSEEKADYYIIVNFPPEGEFYVPQKTIIFQMEPWVNDNSKNWGVKTWGIWAEPDPSLFLHVNSHKKFLNPAQWNFNENLENIPSKKDQVVNILSYKTNDVGHNLRIRFLDEISKIDIYGKENYHKLKSYIGKVPNDNRYNVYSKYKYVLAVENNSETNYATEKIWEALLCECLPFYWGCPNLENYINPNAFVRLPLEDIEESKRIVEQAIKEDWWSMRIDAIREAKKKIINELGFFPMIKNIIKNNT